MSRPRALIDLRTGTRLLLSLPQSQTPTGSQAPASDLTASQTQEINVLLTRLTTHLQNGKLTLSDLPRSLLSFPVPSSPEAQSFHAVVTRLQEAERAWAEKNPVLAAQESELGLYAEYFTAALLEQNEGGKREKWGDIERQARSLEGFVVENKIAAERVRRVGLEEALRRVLRRFADWDREGVFVDGAGGEEGKEEEKECAARVWGLVDKIGSGLAYLLKVDAKYEETLGATNGGSSNQRPTTRSIFLLKSAPPATFSFAASKDEWLERRLIATRAHLEESVLDASNPIKREDEARWNVVYRDLEGLEDFFQRDGRDISIKNIRESKIDETIRLMCERLEVLHQDKKSGEDEAQFALMHISWELATRIGKSFTAMDS